MFLKKLFHKVKWMRTFNNGLRKLIRFRFIHTEQFNTEIRNARIESDNLLIICFGISDTNNLKTLHSFVSPFSIITPVLYDY